MPCLVNCYSKHYRFLAYANTLYTYLIKGEEVDEHIKENYNDFFPAEMRAEEDAREKADNTPNSREEAAVKAMGSIENVKKAMANKMF